MAAVCLGGTRRLLRHTAMMRKASTATETVSDGATAAASDGDGGWPLHRGIQAVAGGAVLGGHAEG